MDFGGVGRERIVLNESSALVRRSLRRQQVRRLPMPAGSARETLRRRYFRRRRRAGQELPLRRRRQRMGGCQPVRLLPDAGRFDRRFRQQPGGEALLPQRARGRRRKRHREHRGRRSRLEVVREQRQHARELADAVARGARPSPPTLSPAATTCRTATRAPGCSKVRRTAKPGSRWIAAPWTSRLRNATRPRRSRSPVPAAFRFYRFTFAPTPVGTFQVAEISLAGTVKPPPPVVG